MIVEFSPTFLRDLKKITDQTLLRRIQTTIEQLEAAVSLQTVPSVTKLQGLGDYYRARIGEYRLGFKADATTAVLLRCLHRREIYRYFP